MFSLRWKSVLRPEFCIIRFLQLYFTSIFSLSFVQQWTKSKFGVFNEYNFHSMRLIFYGSWWIKCEEKWFKQRSRCLGTRRLVLHDHSWLKLALSFLNSVLSLYSFFKSFSFFSYNAKTTRLRVKLIQNDSHLIHNVLKKIDLNEWKLYT